MLDALAPHDSPTLDPTPIFELFRGNHATELLTAAVAHFDLFRRLTRQPLTLAELARELELAERPAVVLTVALRAMGLLRADSDGRLALADLAREFLVPGTRFYVGDYLGLGAESPGVTEMVERLRTNRPAGAKPERRRRGLHLSRGLESAMEKEATARRFTLALAGRAECVAPALAALPRSGRAAVAGRGGRHGHLQHRLP